MSSCNEKTAYRIAGAAEESSMAEGVVARVLACSGWYDGDSEACKKTENFGDFLLSDFARLGQVPGTPTRPPRPGEAPHPAPSARKSVIRLHRKLSSAPLRAPRRLRDPKSGQQRWAQPTPRFRVMSDALLDVMSSCNVRCII